jgi:hypothetical protein
MTADSQDPSPIPPSALDLGHEEAPAGVDRRALMMRSALIGATTAITG